MTKSTIFNWNMNEFKDMYESCKYDEAVTESLKIIPDKKSKILEAGAGSGRVVKYIFDENYKNIVGLEINPTPIKEFRNLYEIPKIVIGDITKPPFKDESFDVVLSYGVVEHFVLGLDKPLASIYKILKKNGLAVITVSSFNKLRQIKFFLKKIINKNKYKESEKEKYKYYLHPPEGPFFEYRLTPKEFELAVKKTGFTILKSMPIYKIDGFYHDVSKNLVKYKNYQFIKTPIGNILNSFLGLFPFFHNHMHLVILKKE